MDVNNSKSELHLEKGTSVCFRSRAWDWDIRGSEFISMIVSQVSIKYCAQVMW